MEIIRITARWTGFAGAPGYSNFYYANDVSGFFDGGLFGDAGQAAAEVAANRVRNGFLAIGPLLPEDVSVSIDPEVLVIDSDSGETLGFTEVDPPGVGGSRDPSGYSAASGAVVNWRTNDYRFGRRIRGRTFLVPLGGSAYEGDGTLTSSALTDLREFADSVASDQGDTYFGVWSRPRGGTGGVFARVTNWSVPDKAAVLRSRRD